MSVREPHQLPLTTQEAFALIWPLDANPQATLLWPNPIYWPEDKRFFAKRLAGACRLFEAFGPIYEKVAQGEMTQDAAMVQLAAAAWGEL